MRAVSSALVIPWIAGCYALHPPDGGGVVAPPAQRSATDPADIAVPDGFRIEAVATDLTFPTGVTFDDQGGVYVTESGYSYGEVFLVPRLVRVDRGRNEEIARGAHPPWNGVTWSDGAFFVAEGGEVGGGRLLKIAADGAQEVLLDGLPSIGDHHTNGPVVGPDGYVYVGQGTATNAGVVGVDNWDFGWLARHPDFHDVPCQDVTLTGVNYRSPDPRPGAAGRSIVTGAYVPFGTATTPGQVIPGDVRCGGSVLRVPIGGGEPEVYAWGLRNPFGLAFSDEGVLYVTENQYDTRGSRQVWGLGDLLRRVDAGSWHGWPDFAGAEPVDQPRWAAERHHPAARLLAEVPGPVVAPAAQFEVHASATGFDFAPNEAWGGPRVAYVALFGDMAPGVGKVMNPVGFRVVRVDVDTGVIAEFATNRGREAGPASWLGSGGLERPVAARFAPDGEALYVVDFGILGMGDEGPKPVPGTGVVWRITRDRALLTAGAP